MALAPGGGPYSSWSSQQTHPGRRVGRAEAVGPRARSSSNLAEAVPRLEGSRPHQERRSALGRRRQKRVAPPGNSGSPGEGLGAWMAPLDCQIAATLLRAARVAALVGRTEPTCLALLAAGGQGAERKAAAMVPGQPRRGAPLRRQAATAREPAPWMMEMQLIPPRPCTEQRPPKDSTAASRRPWLEQAPQETGKRESQHLGLHSG